MLRVSDSDLVHAISVHISIVILLFRINFAMEEVGGKLYVFGGDDTGSKVERLDGNKWTEVESLPAPLEDGGALII